MRVHGIKRVGGAWSLACGEPRPTASEAAGGWCLVHQRRRVRAYRGRKASPGGDSKKVSVCRSVHAPWRRSGSVARSRTYRSKIVSFHSRWQRIARVARIAQFRPALCSMGISVGAKLGDDERDLLNRQIGNECDLAGKAVEIHHDDRALRSASNHGNLLALIPRPIIPFLRLP